VLSNAFAYTYDKAQNLLSRTEKESGVPEAVALPLDGSKRNRPASVGSEALAWGCQRQSDPQRRPA
jgi:hypothetical protein